MCIEYTEHLHTYNIWIKEITYSFSSNVRLCNCMYKTD